MKISAVISTDFRYFCVSIHAIGGGGFSLEQLFALGGFSPFAHCFKLYA